MQTACFLGSTHLDPGQLQTAATRTRYILRDLLNSGVKYFGVGVTPGYDMLAAEMLIRLKNSRSGKRILLISVLPYPGWNEGWSSAEQAEARRILMKSKKVVYLAQQPEEGLLAARDRHLLDGSGHCVCFCNQSTGHTADTLRYAIARKVQVHNASSWDLRWLQHA